MQTSARGHVVPALVAAIEGARPPSPVFCGRCQLIDPARLFARIERDRHLCSTCWRLEGCPWPGWLWGAAETHERELATRERMQRRGGADRYRVRAGKT